MANRYMKRCSISLTVVQSLNHAKSLRPHRLQHAMLPCHSLSPGVFKFISIELMMPFNHLILCHPLLLPSIFPSIRVFSNDLALCNTVDCSPPGSSVHGIFQARILEWVAMLFSRGSSQPRDGTLVSCIGRQILSPLNH